MKRKFRLQKIRRIRSLRDRALASDNEGYIRNCIATFPEVISVSIQSGWNSYSEARMSDGCELSTSWRDETFLSDQLRRLMKEVYFYFIEHFI